jgi:hypothetical protein
MLRSSSPSAPRWIRTPSLVAFSWCALVAGCGATRDDTRANAPPTADIVAGIVPSANAQLVVQGSGERKIVPGTYVMPAASDDARDAAVVVNGAKDLVLDLEGVVLRGGAADTALDACRGFGLVLTDCERVTIRGGHFGGYKVCVAAFGCSEVVIEGSQFDGWYGMRLASTPQAEDQADWLWPHKNDAGEWSARYGAAIALEDCADVRLARCRGRHGQNGVLLTRTTGCTLTDLDFSFLSGWGLALYRSSKNRVAHCVFDYCVRGYSHDVYWRGQDSAGILVFERSCDNVFVENSATHSGDGVFLFGGRDVVEGKAEERGEKDCGGSDRNVFYRNDFSFAVANAIEATFSSDNWAIENRLGGSRQHGVWGGYSTRLVLLWNEILGTRGSGISIEHGVDCAIVGNRIEDGDVGLELWWDADPEFVDGAYGKRFDTASRGHYLAENRFGGNAKDVEITSTSSVAFVNNMCGGKWASLSLNGVAVTGENASKLEARALIEGRDGGFPSGRMRDVSLVEAPAVEPEWLARTRAWQAPALPGSLWSYSRSPSERAGLDTIVMGEFGPWDFRSGDPRPKPRPFGGVLANATWDAVWFAWSPDGGSTNTDPRRDVAAWRALAKAPLATASITAWTDPWGASKSAREATGTKNFGLVARSTVEIKDAGSYTLRVTSDDGVRVVIDGNVALENWTWHGPTRDEAVVELASGRHEFVLEYFQIDGASALAVELVRAATR